MASTIEVAVLALQGAFVEHVNALNRIPGVHAFTVRTPEELAQPIHALVLPGESPFIAETSSHYYLAGGESTSMGLVAERTGILEPLRRLVRETTIPVFGTCAGMILLADRAEHSKTGGQPLIGGLNVTVDRNHFGAQSKSFEANVEVSFPGGPMHGVFIRAPAIVECGDGVQVLGTVVHEGKRVIVAARQGRLLVCAFHVCMYIRSEALALTHAASPSSPPTSACTNSWSTWPDPRPNEQMREE